MLIWDIKEPVVSIAFSPDSTRVAVAGRRKFRIYHVGATEPTVLAYHQCSRQVAFTPDGRSVLTDGPTPDPAEYDNQFTVLDAKTGAVSWLGAVNGHSWSFTLDPQERLVVYSNVEYLSNDLQWYSFTEKCWVDEWIDLAPSGGYVLRFSPDGHQLALPSYMALVVYNVSKREPVGQWTLANGPRVMLDYSPDGTQLVCGAGRRLQVFRDLKPVTELRSGIAYFTSIAFHPSGNYFAATSGDAIIVYDTNAWTVAKTISWKIVRLRSVAFSPDGLLAAAGSDTGKVIVWDVDV